MLPLVQMHPMVQPQLDFLGHHHGHPMPDHPSHYHGAPSHLPQPSPPFDDTDSTPRAFAIRTAQHIPALHRITSSFTRLHAHDHVEHSLRRKTPSGTIDNGYDGSLTHLASGPPPLKHMIVPTSSKIFPTAVVHRPSNPSVGQVLPQARAGTWPYPGAAPSSRFDLGTDGLNGALGMPRGWGQGNPNAALGPLMGDGAVFPPPQLAGNYRASGLQPLLGPGYQQPLSQTVYSPGPFQQPAVWGDGNLGYRTFVPLANNYTPQNSVDSAFMAPQSTIHHGLTNAAGLGQAHPFSLPLPSHPLDDGFARYGQNHLAHQAAHAGRHMVSMTPGPGYLAKAVATGELGSAARFREWALQSAHKNYNDLLYYLTSAKKAGHRRSGSGSRSSSKMVVYPKPSIASAGSGSGAAQPLSGLAEVTASHAHQIVHPQKEAAARAFAGGQHHQTYQEVGSPILNAKASLEMLSTLCERSGWKWVEGMLLGGCLHYGLERYDEALEWFKRIVSLDQRCVAAIVRFLVNDRRVNKYQPCRSDF